LSAWTGEWAAAVVRYHDLALGQARRRSRVLQAIGDDGIRRGHGKRQFELLTFVNGRVAKPPQPTGPPNRVSPEARDALRELYDTGRVLRLRRGVCGPYTHTQRPERSGKAGQTVIRFLAPKPERRENALIDARRRLSRVPWNFGSEVTTVFGRDLIPELGGRFVAGMNM